MTRNQIKGLPLPPAIGARHNPIPYGSYIDCGEEALDKAGMSITQEEHIIGHHGDRYFGLMEVTAKEGQLITSDEWKLLVGLRGSHDQSTPRGLCLGRQVLVCSNLCFGGDIANMQTKQTLNVLDRLPGLIYNAVQQIPELAEREYHRVENMKDFEMPQRVGDAALVELLRRGAITTGQISRAAQEWVEPCHPEFAENGFNLFRLEQAVTEAIKPTGASSNIFTATRRTQIASEFFDSFIGF
jgi:hypothetical protein